MVAAHDRHSHCLARRHKVGAVGAHGGVQPGSMRQTPGVAAHDRHGRCSAAQGRRQALPLMIGLAVVRPGSTRQTPGVSAHDRHGRWSARQQKADARCCRSRELWPLFGPAAQGRRPRRHSAVQGRYIRRQRMTHAIHAKRYGRRLIVYADARISSALKPAICLKHALLTAAAHARPAATNPRRACNRCNQCRST